MKSHTKLTLAIVALLCIGAEALAQQPPAPPAPPPPHGTPVTLEQAKKLATATVAEGVRNGWKLVVAIVEPSGDLVYFERADGVQYASFNLALAKARASALYRRPTKVFADAVNSGQLFFLSFKDVIAVDGGHPIVVDGKLIGGIGVTGATAAQDSQSAMAGLATLK